MGSLLKEYCNLSSTNTKVNWNDQGLLQVHVCIRLLRFMPLGHAMPRGYCDPLSEVMCALVFGRFYSLLPCASLVADTRCSAHLSRSGRRLDTVRCCY